eukprot:tig00020780_g13814.t1
MAGGVDVAAFLGALKEETCCVLNTVDDEDLKEIFMLALHDGPAFVRFLNELVMFQEAVGSVDPSNVKHLALKLHQDNGDLQRAITRYVTMDEEDQQRELEPDLPQYQNQQAPPNGRQPQAAQQAAQPGQAARGEGPGSGSKRKAPEEDGSDSDLEVVEVKCKPGAKIDSSVPHARCHCSTHPMEQNSPPEICRAFCANCYCYVCDVKASECAEWDDHCCAWDRDIAWKKRREAFRGGPSRASPSEAPAPDPPAPARAPAPPAPPASSSAAAAGPSSSASASAPASASSSSAPASSSSSAAAARASGGAPGPSGSGGTRRAELEGRAVAQLREAHREIVALFGLDPMTQLAPPPHLAPAAPHGWPQAPHPLPQMGHAGPHAAQFAALHGQMAAAHAAAAGRGGATDTPPPLPRRAPPPRRRPRPPTASQVVVEVPAAAPSPPAEAAHASPFSLYQWAGANAPAAGENAQLRALVELVGADPPQHAQPGEGSFRVTCEAVTQRPPASVAYRYQARPAAAAGRGGGGDGAQVEVHRERMRQRTGPGDGIWLAALGEVLRSVAQRQRVSGAWTAAQGEAFERVLGAPRGWAPPPAPGVSAAQLLDGSRIGQFEAAAPQPPRELLRSPLAPGELRTLARLLAAEARDGPGLRGGLWARFPCDGGARQLLWSPALEHVALSDQLPPPARGGILSHGVDISVSQPSGAFHEMMTALLALVALDRSAPPPQGSGGGVALRATLIVCPKHFVNVWRDQAVRVLPQGSAVCVHAGTRRAKDAGGLAREELVILADSLLAKDPAIASAEFRRVILHEPAFLSRLSQQMSQRAVALRAPCRWILAASALPGARWRSSRPPRLPPPRPPRPAPLAPSPDAPQAPLHDPPDFVRIVARPLKGGPGQARAAAVAAALLRAVVVRHDGAPAAGPHAPAPPHLLAPPLFHPAPELAPPSSDPEPFEARCQLGKGVGGAG